MEYENDNYDEKSVDNNNYSDNNYYNNSNDNKKSFPILLVIMVIVLIVLLFFLFKSCNNDANNKTIDINLENTTMQMKVGDVEQIKLTSNYEIDYSLLHFVSNNEKVTTVDDKGFVTALEKGTSIITIKYIGNKSDTYILDCIITVDDKKIAYEISNNTWSKESVIITLDPTLNTGIENMKYGVNCKESETCKYNDVIDNKIVIDENGLNEVKIIGTNKNGTLIEEIIVAKVDKKGPNIELNIKDNIIYNNTGKVEVCGICTDNESGCVKDKECKEYTENKSKETITIDDKLGNKGTSQEFNIIMDTEKPECSFVEATIASIKIDASTTLTLQCTDNLSGIKNSDIYINNINLSNSGIVEITNIEKTTISNGFQYKLSIKGKTAGTTNITINSNTITDNANNIQDSVTSNNITVQANCTWQATTTTSSSCTSTTQPQSPNIGDTYTTCAGPYYGKWRFNGFELQCANGSKTKTGASSYQYDSKALAEQACQSAWLSTSSGYCHDKGGGSGGPSSVCKASRYTYYTKTTYTCGTSNSSTNTCTRQSSCGCESYNDWKSSGTQQFNQSCTTNPAKTLTTKRWTDCTPSVQPNNKDENNNAMCTWTCKYATKTCKQYKCC